jgi:hypothetical protein
MFVGHYGISFAAKRSAVGLPLWVWFIAVQWLDVVWSLLVLLGIEKLRIVPGFTQANALDLYYMPFASHIGCSICWCTHPTCHFTIMPPRSGLGCGSMWPSAFQLNLRCLAWVLGSTRARPFSPVPWAG